MKQTIMVITVALIFSAHLSAAPDAVELMMNEYQAQGASASSSEQGRKLWQTETNGRSCTNCHTDDPRAQGRHQKTGKAIEALAPSVNTKRLTKTKTIRKWLKRNCKWTFGQECTAQQKGDFLAWLRQQ
ncbi:MAG: DUF1924 domain-containing protein [Motiliproteus sp.]